MRSFLLRPESLVVVFAALAAPACVAASGSTSDESSSEAVSTAGPAAIARPDLHEHGTVHANKRVCTPRSDGTTCDVRVWTNEEGATAYAESAGATGGFGAMDLANAYSIPTSVESNTTIAIVDWNDDPMAESDLGVYRANYGLPPCTTANGCFKKLMVPTGTPPKGPAPADGGQDIEISLDLDMASAGCPSCKIILVEDDDQYAGVNAAVAAGATVVSMSWGGPEWSGETQNDSAYFNHPGVAFFASTGDIGYVPVAYPSSSPNVVGVGGTALSTIPWTPGAPSSISRYWTETAWAGSVSGCSAFEAKPWWQSDPGCSNRTLADVSAVAGPDQGIIVYDTYASSSSNPGGWITTGGTSASSPLVAGIYAQTRIGNSSTAIWYESAGTWLHDVTSGSTTNCNGTYLCNAGPGYDGPTGLGTPNGARMANSPEIATVSPDSGMWNAAHTVTITGSGFSTAPGFTHVTLYNTGGLAATNVTCSSSTQCTATLPAVDAATSVELIATVGGHSSPLGLQTMFTYEPPQIRRGI